MDTKIQIVKFEAKFASDKQLGFMKSLFWKFVQIKLGPRFDPSSWEMSSQRYWDNFLGKHPELLVHTVLEDLHGCSSLYRIDSLSASKIINYLKVVVDAHPDFEYRRGGFVSRFGKDYFNNLKTDRQAQIAQMSDYQKHQAHITA